MLGPQTLSQTYLGAGQPAVCRQHGGPIQHQRNGLRHAQLLVALRQRLPRDRAPARLCQNVRQSITVNQWTRCLMLALRQRLPRNRTPAHNFSRGSTGIWEDVLLCV